MQKWEFKRGILLVLVIAFPFLGRAVSTDLTMGANGTAASPDDPVTWPGGNLNATKTHYVEGYSVPCRLPMIGLTSGTHTIVFQWNTQISGKAANDYLTHYNRILPHNQFGTHTTPEQINPLTGLTGPFYSTNTFPIPTPSGVGSPVLGQPAASFNALPANERLMTIYNGTIVSMVYTNVEDLTEAGSKSGMAVTFSTTNSTVVLAFGGHLGSKYDWGAGGSASSISGSSYHINNVSLDGASAGGIANLATGSITAPPTCGLSGSSLVCPGATNIYSTQTDATSPSYIWSLTNNTAGASIVGATNLSSVSVRSGGSGSYLVRVTILDGQANSTCEQFVFVGTNTSATVLSNLTVCPGQNATFNTTPSGTGPFSFVWKKNGTVLAGQAGSSLSIANATATNAGNYCVIVSGACKSVTNCADLTVRTNLTIISSSMTNQTKCSGDSLNLSVAAAGSGSPQFIWKKDGLVISGQTSSSYNFPSLSTSDTGTYSVEIVGLCNSLTNSAVITVNLGTSITPLANTSKCPGASVTFSTTVSGSGPFSFLWQRNSITIPGQTNNSLIIPSVSGSDAGIYTVQVQGACNTASSSATLTINNDVSLASISPQSKCAGENVVFTAVPSGSGPFDFAWKLNGNPVGTNGPDLTIDTSSLSSGNYSVGVVVTGTCGSATNSTTLTISTPTSASTLSPASICQGATKNFSVTPGGTGPFSYFWTVDGNSIGTNGASVTVETAALSIGQHTLSVTVSGVCGSVTNQTILTVNPSPSYLIIGSDLVCPHSTANVYTGPSNLLLYAWMISGNGTILSTTNAQTVTVDSSDAGAFTLSLFTTDTNGCNTISQIVVTVGDTNPPSIITCPTNQVLAANPGTCSRSNVVFAVNAVDNCGSVTVVSTPPSGSTFPIGTTTVTNVVTDTAGNSNVCIFTVTVIDTEAPNIVNCPTNQVLAANPGTCSRSNVVFAVNAVDNCGSVTVVSTPPSGSTFPIGTTTVTNVVTDTAGNSNVCTFTVTVIDTEAPNIVNCPTNQVLAANPGTCSRSNVVFAVNAVDNCGSVTVVSTPPSGSTFPIGTTTVTNVVTDTAGNSNVCTFTVTVIDTEAPNILNCPTNQVLAANPGTCSRSNVVFAVNAVDNCGSVTVVSTPPSGSTFPIGTTTVTNVVTDTAGNSNVCTFTVTVIDTEAPNIVNCPTNQVLAANPGTCSRSNVVFAVNAVDNCGSVTVVSTPPSGSTFPIGTTTVTNVVTDTAGNSNVCIFTVTVIDTEAPTILNCPTNQVLAANPGTCSRSNVVFAVNAVDNCGSVTVVSTPPSGSTFPIGTTTVTNVVTDTAGNSNVCTFTVTVIDTEAPNILNCPTNQVLAANPGTCSRSNVVFAVNAVDNCGSVTVVSTPPSGSTFPIGTTTVTNVVTDTAGNSNVCTFTVTVIDTEAPNILNCPTNQVLAANPGTCSRSNVVFAVNAVDNCGSVTVVSTPPSGSTFPIGTTTVTNVVTDTAGNSNVCTFTVTVIDTEAPNIVNCPTNQVLAANPGTCSRSNVVFAVNAVDNCGSVTVVSTPPSGSTFPIGTTTVTNVVTDTAGNSNVCTFTVTVIDTEAPNILNCPTNQVLAANPGTCSRSNVVFAVNAVDNCGSVTVVSTPPSGSTFPIGTTTVTNVVTDTAGNSNVCTFTVTVIDTEAPNIVNCPTNQVLAANPGTCSRSNVVFAVNAVDNCGSVTVVSTPPSGSTFPIGTTTVTNVVTDTAGNSNVCTFTVTVIDTEAPNILNCPTNQVLAANPGTCSRSNVVFAVNAVDNCGSVTVVSTPPSGSTFPIGTTTVTNVVTDTAGNSNVCTFTVTVIDTEAPNILNCPTNQVLAANPGTCSRSNVVFAVNAVDNCGSVTVVSTPPSGSTFPIGTTTVTNVVTDTAGNSNVCTFTVTVIDTEAPNILNCPTNLVFCPDPGQTTKSNVTYAATATDNCSGATITFSPPSGSTFPQGTTTVICIATDASGNTNSCSFTVTVNQTVSVQPLISLTNCPNSSASFSALVSGTGPFTFVWRKDGSIIGGQTNSSFNLISLVGSNAGIYSVEVSGACNSVTNQATLTMNSNIAATALISRTNCPGENAFFSTVPSGAAPFSFIWKKNGSNINGQTNSSLAITNLVATNAGTYSVEVSGACGSITNSASLTINIPTSATSLISQTKCSGTSATFNTIASGTGPFSYVWRKDGGLLQGETAASLALTNLIPANAGVYSVEVSGSCNTITNFASLIVNSNLAITPLPPIVVCVSNSATFSTIATGTGPFNYLWRKNGTPISGQTTSTLTFASVVATNAGTYTVEVSGPCNSATNSATLTVSGFISATALTNQSVCSCQAATFTTTASGAGPFSFVWKKGGEIIPGQTTNTLYLQSLKTNDSGLYTVEVSGSCNTTGSSATLTVEPEITQNPLVLSNSTQIIINDVAKATPYPSSINVKCLFGTIRKMTVTLHQLSHSYPDDIDMCLIGPDGKGIKLMSDVGGEWPLQNVALTFNQSAADFLPDSGQIFSGVYKPTDFESNDPFLAPAVTTNLVSSLSDFSGTKLNGNWSLFILDDAGGDSGSIAQGWSLSMEYDVFVPTITDVKSLGDGSFQFTVRGEPTISRIVEGSKNLVDWIPLSTNTVSGPAMIFIDAATASNYRFYRAREKRNPQILQDSP